MFDLLIKNGVVVDGTGAPRRSADVAIRDGRIAEIGRVDGAARREIDARGHVVAPGFVDIHTHYDAQAFWDGTLSPSPFHGVTTVVGGNCGFSIAPLSPDAAGYLKRMLARVEGMPLESLEAGVPWDWTSFGEYLARLDGRLAVNAGFLVGHSALRRVVMGEAAIGEPASDAALRGMQELLRESLAQGGLGFSSSAAPTHNDSEGRPVPSRFATREEFLALARAVRDFPGTTLEFIPTVGDVQRGAAGPDGLDVAGREPPAQLERAGRRVLRAESLRGAARRVRLRRRARRPGDRADALAGDEAAHQSGDRLHLRRAARLGRRARPPASRAHARAARPGRARAAPEGSQLPRRRARFARSRPGRT